MAASGYTSFCRDVLDAVETDTELNDKYRKILQDYYFRPDTDLGSLPDDDPVVSKYLDQIERCHSIVLSGYHRVQTHDANSPEHPTLNIKLKNVPKPTSYDPEGSECKKYVQAHRICGEEEPKIVQFLVNHVTFISFEKFICDFYTLIDQFNEKYSGSDEKFYIKYTPNKSSEWILDIFKDEFQVDYTPILEEQYPVEKNATIVFLDDGSYSGKQISEYVAKNIQKSRDSKIITLIPYMTNKALENLAWHIKNYRRVGDNTKDEIMYVEIIQTIAEIIDEHGHEIDVKNLEDKITTMKRDGTDKGDRSSVDKMTLTYLEHKTPDYMSAINQIFRTGLGFSCINPRKRGPTKDTWNCVEPVVPPYKLKSNPGVYSDEMEEFKTKNKAYSLEYRQERDKFF